MNFCRVKLEKRLVKAGMSKREAVFESRRVQILIEKKAGLSESKYEHWDAFNIDDINRAREDGLAAKVEPPGGYMAAVQAKVKEPRAERTKNARAKFIKNGTKLCSDTAKKLDDAVAGEVRKPEEDRVMLSGWSDKMERCFKEVKAKGTPASSAAPICQSSTGG